MQYAYGLSIPQTLADACDPTRMALIVYDMQLVPELTPGPNEVVIDKITMSAFAAIALRDLGIDTYAIAGIALEVGIEPTVRHSLDLGYLPILVTDACGAGHSAAAERSLATLAFAGGSLTTDAAELVERMHRH